MQYREIFTNPTQVRPGDSISVQGRWETVTELYETVEPRYTNSEGVVIFTTERVLHCTPSEGVAIRIHGKIDNGDSE